MRILLTNDDGIHAPGLAALVSQFEGLGQLHVVAPATHQSGASHGISVSEPLRARRVRVHGLWDGWAVSGRPADCVKLGLAELLGFRPDVVVSGINDGANVGVNVLYSGTVAAAAQAALFGIPSVALSLQWSGKMDFASVGRHAAGWLPGALERGISPGVVMNLNYPAGYCGDRLELRLVRQSTACPPDLYEARRDPFGNVYYWSASGDLKGCTHDADTDVAALAAGCITLCPLRFDVTDHPELSRLARACAFGVSHPAG